MKYIFRGKAEEYTHLRPGIVCSFYGTINVFFGWEAVG